MPQLLNEPAWQFRHSAQCNAPRKFAWSYWTNIGNWDDPPATFALDGPFGVGSRLTTTMPGQTWHSIIRACKAGREAIIEMQLPDAILSFHWQFEELPQNRTQITQWLVLSGPNANSFVAQVSIFEKTAPGGMKKLAAAIEQAHRRLQRVSKRPS